MNATVYCCGIDETVANNVFDISLANKGAMKFGRWAEASANINFSRNIVFSDDERKTHFDGKLGPEIDPTRRILCFAEPQIIGCVDYNLYFNKKSKELMFSTKRAKENLNWKEWRELGAKYVGFDQNTKIADPNFVDVEARDYRLKENSPALDMGIKSIDTAQIGLLQDYPFADKKDPLKTLFLKAKGEDVYLESKADEILQLEVSGRTEKWYMADLSQSKVTYSISNPSLATVTPSGKVSLKGRGRVVITAKVTHNGSTKSDDLVIYSGLKRK